MGWRFWRGAPGGLLRRGALWAIVGLLGLVAGGQWVWHGWLPDRRPALKEGERYGIDVSGHEDDDIDWVEVAGDGIDFAYLKATEGGDLVDPTFARNWREAGRAGLDRGAYHFFTFCRSGSEQADNFLEAVPVDMAALPPAIDLELAGNCAARPSQAWIDVEVGTWVRQVEAATGQDVVFYVGEDFRGRYDVPSAGGRPLWKRRTFLRPVTGDWWIWQASYRARVAGIDGGVDLNVMRAEPPLR